MLQLVYRDYSADINKLNSYMFCKPLSKAFILFSFGRAGVIITSTRLHKTNHYINHMYI